MKDAFRRRLLGFGVLLLAVLGMVWVTPSDAQDQINYISQPDEMTIFLNSVVSVRDELSVPVNVETQIVLPAQIVVDTLILRDADGRLPLYNIRQRSGQTVLTLHGENTAEATESGVRQLTLEYITLGGISWRPRYDLFVTSAEDDIVAFDFFAEIRNDTFTLEETQVNLAAEAVTVSGEPVAYTSGFDTNQAFGDAQATATAYTYPQNAPGDAGGAGFFPTGTPAPVQPSTAPVIPTTGQSVYRLDALTSEPGEVLYTELLETTFTARRVLVWNADIETQANIIYKVLNDSELSLTDGIVRTYMDGLFTGSDEVEYTPPGGEGSITVAPLRDVRVRREITSVTVTAENRNDEDGYETLRTVTLTLTNLTPETQEIEVADTFPGSAFSFQFEEETSTPEFRGGNVLRWLVTVEPGYTLRLVYSYRMPW